MPLRLAPLVLGALLLGVTPLQAQRQRCGTPGRRAPDALPLVQPSDCGYWTNVPDAGYAPTTFYDVPVVFHVLNSASGEGFLDLATIQDQIDVLNEDFQALPGSLGAPGTDARVRFHLAEQDPQGNFTSGVTYSTNDDWFVDEGEYWDALAWDTSRYLNVYTNAVPCCYGYVPDFASAGGLVGTPEDRVVVWFMAVGKDPTPGWPGNRGRTLTHEVGHYLGLYHTFDSGCGSSSNCYGTADLICDTEPQADSTWGCPSATTSCGTPDPIHNYMDYTDDVCMWEFTPEQVLRMRCTFENWRPDLTVAFPAQEVVRAGDPPNPGALLPGQSAGPLAGQVWDPVVDHASFVPAAILDVLVVSASTLELDLGPTGTLLCGVPFLLLTSSPSPGESFEVPIPSEFALLGLGLCAQAVSTADGVQYALTNALDATIGNL